MSVEGSSADGVGVKGRMSVKRAVAAGAVLAAMSLGAAAAQTPPVKADADLAARVHRILSQTPLIDGHNDLPWEIRDRFGGKLDRVDLKADTAHLPLSGDQVPLMTDIPRLRAGQVGGQVR